MTVHRVVPNLPSQSPADATGFYTDIFGLQTVMDEGWVVTMADPHRPMAQLTLLTADATAPVSPAVSIEVSDVDATYAAAIEAGAEIVYRLTDEEWGVRRFFVRDPGGTVINVLSHR